MGYVFGLGGVNMKNLKKYEILKPITIGYLDKNNNVVLFKWCRSSLIKK